MKRPRHSLALIGMIAACGIGAIAYAQIEGNDRGVPPIDSSANYEVTGVAVDVSAKDADRARLFGWRLAQRRAWKQLWGRVNGQPATAAPTLPDSQLDDIVAGIAVENEEIGPHRYIARLGVLFDRGRAGPVLGVQGATQRSWPMLVIPVMWSGGTPQSFEHRTEWQKAWARFRSGGSPIDYVRPTGSGIDPLILTAAQAGRPGRGQWRALLDRYGASDVVVPTVQIIRRYPGGPVLAHFAALHGPDGAAIARFTLTAPDSDGLPHMLDEGVRRIDDAYAAALRSGRLGADPGLTIEPVAIPSLAEEAPVITSDAPATTLAPAPSTILLQVDTPDDPALLQVQASLRAIPGIRTVSADSVALGGVSVMRATFDGDPQALRAALVAAGYSVEDAGGGMRLRRAVAR